MAHTVASLSNYSGSSLLRLTLQVQNEPQIQQRKQLKKQYQFIQAVTITFETPNNDVQVRRQETHSAVEQEGR